MKSSSKINQVIKIIDVYYQLEEAEDVFQKIPSESHRLQMIRLYRRLESMSKKLKESVDQETSEFEEIIAAGVLLFKKISALSGSDSTPIDL